MDLKLKKSLLSSGFSWWVIFWLVVSTNLKNTLQTWSFPQVGVKIKHDRNHHLVLLGHQYLTLLDLFWPYFCCPTTILLPKVVVIHATCTPQVWSGSNEKDMNVTIFWRGIEQNSLKDGQQFCNLCGSPDMFGWNCQFFRIRLGLGDGCSWYETKYQSNCLDKIRPKFIIVSTLQNKLDISFSKSFREGLRSKSLENRCHVFFSPLCSIVCRAPSLAQSAGKRQAAYSSSSFSSLMLK